LSFPPHNENNSGVFNNADGFAMAFDAAWKDYQPPQDECIESTEKKMNLVLDSIKDHPFVQSSPSQAKEVAEFRIRFLRLA